MIYSFQAIIWFDFILNCELFYNTFVEPITTAGHIVWCHSATHICHANKIYWLNDSEVSANNILNACLLEIAWIKIRNFVNLLMQINEKQNMIKTMLVLIIFPFYFQLLFLNNYYTDFLCILFHFTSYHFSCIVAYCSFFCN